MKIGFLGMGVMGLGMAKNVLAKCGQPMLAYDVMEKQCEAFKAAGMRDDVKIIVGGAPVTETVCASVGADEWALSPQKTVSVCQGWAS